MCQLSVQGWVFPDQDGTTRAHADDVLLPRTDLEAGDVATVAHSNVSHRALVIVPQLHQMVVTTCIGHKGRTHDYAEFCCFLFPDQRQGNIYAFTSLRKGGIHCLGLMAQTTSFQLKYRVRVQQSAQDLHEQVTVSFGQQLVPIVQSAFDRLLTNPRLRGSSKELVLTSNLWGLTIVVIHGTMASVYASARLPVTMVENM